MVANGESFLVGPRCDSFTLTISYKAIDSLTSSVLTTPHKDMVISALRIAVGAYSIENIPKSLRVMGRIVALKPGQKRWYSIHLSPQEIALSVRNGFVTIGVDQCFDSSISPVLDAMEVYGIKRQEIEQWFPVDFRQCAVHRPIAESSSDSDKPFVPINLKQNGFQLCLMALTNMHSLFGLLKPRKEEGEEAFLKQLVEDTALENNTGIKLGVAGLVASFKPNDDARQSFLDMAVLSGCSAFLNQCQLRLDKCKSGNFNTQVLHLWHSLTPALRTCLQTAAGIAKRRPFNYLRVAEERPTSFNSIAADACQLVLSYLPKSLGNNSLVSDLVELSLLEIAITNGRRLGTFGSFEGLRNFLSSTNTIVAGQACSAISVFFRECNIFYTLTKAVQYVCDSCLGVIPDTRFTSVDDAQPFDLCPDCYQLGHEFITGTRSGDVTNVIIKGKLVGDEQKLTCDAVNRMQAVAICNDAAEARQTSELLSEKVGGSLKVKPPLSAQQQLFNDFMDVLISGVSELIENLLRKPDYVPENMVWISVEFVRYSFHSGRKLDKTKKLVEALAEGLACRLRNASPLMRTDSQCVLFIEGLTQMVLPNQSAQDYIVGACPYTSTEDQQMQNPTSGICDSHRVPLKVFKFTGGKDANRTFLGCSMEKKSKCNAFVWTDKPIVRNEGNQQSGSVFLEQVAKLVWQLLMETKGDHDKPLHLLLASFIHRFSNNELRKESSNELQKAIESNNKSVHSRSDGYSIDRDFDDGVFCSHFRLKNNYYEQRMAFLNQQYRQSCSTGMDQLCNVNCVEKSLRLLALTAAPGQRSHSEWFPILCHIMLHSNSQGSVLPILAKASLHKLCGALCYQVRDFYSFTFKFKNLIESSANVLRYSVLLNEKARQCSPSWKTSTSQQFSTLKIGDFTGVEDLMSEDASTLHLNEMVNKILSEMWALASKQGGSWKRFCGVRSLQQLEFVSVSGSIELLDFYRASPLSVLFSLCSSVSAENKVKALRLLCLGLAQSNDRRPEGVKAVSKGKPNSSDDDDVEGTPECQDLFRFLGAQGSSALDVAAVSTDDLYAFVMRLAYRGNTSEIRILACKVAIRLCRCLQKQDLGTLVVRFMRNPVFQCGATGKRSSDFLSFLQALVKFAGPSNMDVGALAPQVQSHFKQQILALRHDRSNGDCIYFEARSSAMVQKKKYDLCRCVSCCLHVPRAKDKGAEKMASTIKNGRGGHQGSGRTPPSGMSKLKWVSGQVSSFVRCRLHASKESFASNEFCMFYSLKNRCAIAEIHLEVDNQRRHVKTVKFYFSPRPVEDPSMLKSASFLENWQPCGTLNLSRGSSRATLTIGPPVVASNLKIEYTDFYDAGTSRCSDGTLVVLCPRCTCAVTNAHGVCSNCGEVAFQCRKCRHINYDRLDAFLCVECGYCASASFQFELTAGVASNSVAVTNDSEYKAMVKMADLALRLYKDLKAALKLKLATLVRCKKKGGPTGEAEGGRGQTMDSIFRAYEVSREHGANVDDSLDFSKLTSSQLGIDGSIVKLVARPDACGGSSLYRLARRSEQSIGRHSDNMMIRGFRVEDETASELLGGLLDGSGGFSRLAGLDAGDPLSQLLASVQSRRERREADEREHAGGNESCGNKKSMQSNAKEAMEVTDRLFNLMREAEREAYRLESRCIAWRRLNSGRLADLGMEQQQQNYFDPSHCSSCASTIAVQLLVLWLRFFHLNPDGVSIDQEMISLLLSDVATGHLRNLQETRKEIVREIAILSKQGRPLVLEALRARLNLTQDVNSAEILSKILETIGGDQEAAAPFVALAREALEVNASSS